jgi:hypothetical protein
MSDARALLRGSPPDPDRAETPDRALAIEARQIGMLTLEQKRAMERLVGRELLAEVVQRLPAERREEFEDLSMFAWCRCSTLNMVLAGVAEASGRDVESFVHDVVRRSFGVVLRSVWRLLARFTSDSAIVERASILYGRTLDRGKAGAFFVSYDHMALEITERPDLSHIDVISIAAAVEAVFDVAQRRVRVSYRRLPDGVRYDVRRRSTPIPSTPP